MKKEWFSTMELAGVGGLPSTIQGINQKAKREDWKSRKRLGVQGKALEYHIDSLPNDARHLLFLKDNGGIYSPSAQEPLAVWIATYHQLTLSEREQVIGLIMRKGISGLMEQLCIHREDKYPLSDEQKE